MISFFICSTKRLYSSTWRCRLRFACYSCATIALSTWLFPFFSPSPFLSPSEATEMSDGCFSPILFSRLLMNLAAVSLLAFSIW
jgi:hypothetical protein